MDTISLPFPNVQFQNVNYFLTPLACGTYLREKWALFVFFLMKGKLHHPFMSCFIHSFHRVSLWTKFLTINMWVSKKSLLPRVPKSINTSSSCFIIPKSQITCKLGGGGTLPWRKNWHFLYCISKSIGAIFFPSSLQNCWMIISKG
jgi:hypothetical protein